MRKEGSARAAPPARKPLRKTGGRRRSVRNKGKSMQTSKDPVKNFKNLPTIPNSLTELMMMMAVAKLREPGEDSRRREGLDLEDRDNLISFLPGTKTFFKTEPELRKY